MNKIFRLFLIVLVFTCDKAFADATPFKDEERIEFSYPTPKKELFDRCGIIYRNYQTNELDTFFGCDGGECITSANVNGVRLIRLIPNSFRVVLYYKDKVLTSSVLSQNGLRSYHRLLITETAIKDITPIFKTRYANYLIALSTTILLELLVALIYFRRRRISLRNLPYIIYVNLLTHPVLWLVSANFTGFETGNLIGEPIVVIIEGLLLHHFIGAPLTVGKSIWLSFQMNLVSFILGGFIYFILSS